MERTIEELLEKIRKDGRTLQDVPDHLKTEDMCMTAVMEDGRALEWVPEPLKTADICMAAVRQNGWALRHVPEALKEPDICMAAVRQDGWGLAWVPHALKTPEICREAVRKNGEALEWVPEALKTAELCLEAVKAPQGALSLALRHVPEERKTKKLCLAAVRHDGRALEFVPDGIRSEVERLLAEPAAPSSGDPLEAACVAFNARAGECPLPEGCSLKLEAERLEGGRISLRIALAEQEERLYAPGMEPSASAVYLPGRDGTPPDPAKCLRAFAEKLEGKADKPVETMPKGMKDFCAGAVRAAAEAAAACGAVLEKEEQEGFSPAP